MGRVLVAANLKGGVGKTTSALNIAAAAATDAHGAPRVAVVDADPQQSALDWSAAAEEDGGLPYPVMAARGRQAGRTIKELAQHYDLVLVDTPPGEEAIATVRACMDVADLVLIPCSPTGLDVTRLVRTVKLAGEVGAVAAVLITRTDRRWVAHREMVEALADMPEVVPLQAVIRATVRLGEMFGSPLWNVNDDYRAAWAELRPALYAKE